MESPHHPPNCYQVSAIESAVQSLDAKASFMRRVNPGDTVGVPDIIIAFPPQADLVAVVSQLAGRGAEAGGGDGGSEENTLAEVTGGTTCVCVRVCAKSLFPISPAR